VLSVVRLLCVPSPCTVRLGRCVRAAGPDGLGGGRWNASGRERSAGPSRKRRGVASSDVGAVVSVLTGRVVASSSRRRSVRRPSRGGPLPCRRVGAGACALVRQRFLRADSGDDSGGNRSPPVRGGSVVARASEIRRWHVGGRRVGVGKKKKNRKNKKQNKMGFLVLQD